MIVVVDTSILIDYLRRHPLARQLMTELNDRGDELWSSTIVRTELLAGMRKDEEPGTMALFGAIRWQNVTIEIADLAGRLSNQYGRSHRGIDTSDYVIAATTKFLDGKLLTHHVKHFPMFVGLTPAY